MYVEPGYVSPLCDAAVSHQARLYVSFRVTAEIGWRPVIAVTATLVATHMELSHEAKDLASAGKVACF